MFTSSNTNSFGFLFLRITDTFNYIATCAVEDSLLILKSKFGWIISTIDDLNFFWKSHLNYRKIRCHREVCGKFNTHTHTHTHPQKNYFDYNINCLAFSTLDKSARASVGVWSPKFPWWLLWLSLTRFALLWLSYFGLPRGKFHVLSTFPPNLKA